jgi:hypothetical protein
LSVVVAPTGRGDGLAGALAALRGQEGAPPFEVIVPYDSSVASIAALRSAYPDHHFLSVEGSDALASSSDIGVRHEAIDRRRAAGLRAARAPIVALTEEFARPAANWCARLVALHAALPHAVIGGAIENANDSVINWALFFGDAGRYQEPVPEGPAAFVSDVNVSYKRAPLFSVAETWRERYHETGLHDALRRQGHVLWLARDLVVRQDRGQIALREAVRERYAWARLYAGRRAAEVGPITRVTLALGSPALGPVLFLRQSRTTWARRRHRRPFLRSALILLVMNVVRSAGEFVGYVSGRSTGSPTLISPTPR